MKQTYIYTIFVAVLLILIGYIFKQQVEMKYIQHEQIIGAQAQVIQNNSNAIQQVVDYLNEQAQPKQEETPFKVGE